MAREIPDKQHQEDFAVGESLSKRGIVAHHDARYCHEERRLYRDAIVEADAFLSLHKCDPAEMRAIHERLQKRKSFCPDGAD